MTFPGPKGIWLTSERTFHWRSRIAFKGTSLPRKVHWNCFDIKPRTRGKSATTVTNGEGDYSLRTLLLVDYKQITPLNCLKIRVEHQKAVEWLTVGWRAIPAWQYLRKGRLTASNSGLILKAKRITPSLMKRVLSEYDLSGIQAIAWGIGNEADICRWRID